MIKFVSVLMLTTALFISPRMMAGIGNAYPTSGENPTIDLKSVMNMSAHVLYDSLNLGDLGLNPRAFKLAWKGFLHLAESGKLMNTDYFTVCDFSQSSRNKRLYIIDLTQMRVFKNTYVAHGRNSGGEFAQAFSNRPESHKSSLGFYITGETYFGQHGLSLKMKGIEPGINDKAMARRIVMHGSSYVGDEFLNNNPFSGRSFGCPAIPADERDEIINTIKEGTLLFIYHPSKTYITKSKILNG